MSRRTEALYTRGLQLSSWSADELSEAGRRTLAGTVTADTLLTVVASEGTAVVETLVVALRRPVVLPGAEGLVAASRGLPRPGSHLNIEVYDPFAAEVRLRASPWRATPSSWCPTAPSSTPRSAAGAWRTATPCAPGGSTGTKAASPWPGGWTGPA